MLAALALAGPTEGAPAIIALTLPSGKVLETEVMSNDPDREMGLMFRPSLAEDHGMLFVFETSDFHSFWMKNCKFPIDIVWLDPDQKVVHLAERVPPCRRDPCPTYPPLRRGLYVVEMSAGQARREGVTVGATLTFTLPR